MYKHTPEYRSDGNRIFWFQCVYEIHFSAGLNKLISCLDKRYSKDSARKKTAAFKALPRVVRSPAKILPRANAPDWAVKPMYRQSVTSPTIVSAIDSLVVPWAARLIVSAYCFQRSRLTIVSAY